MRKAMAVVGAAAVVLILLLGAQAAASDGSALPTPAWDLLRSLGWPGALVAGLFSPVGKAIAAWVTAVTPAKTTSAQDQQLAAQLKSISGALTEMAEAVRRSSKVQEQTAQTLMQIQQGMAVLLDRTAR